MYLAAGEAAAKVSGSTWEDLIQQRIFTPLGMTSSVPIARDPARLTNFASSHGMAKDSVFAVAHFSADDIAPAGSIAASARDMAQYLRFQLGDGTFGGKRLVSVAALRETHTPQILTGGGAGGGAGGDSLTRFSTYGMGWFVQDYRKALVWQHGGNTDGMTAAMGLLPEHRFGVVVLANMAGAQLPDLLMRWIFDRQLGAPMRDLSAEARARYVTQRQRADSLERVQASQRVAGAQPPLPLTAFVGTYADSLYGEGTITLENGRLVFERGEWKGPLEYWNVGHFRWGPLPSAVVPALQVKFDFTPDGKVSGLSFTVGADLVSMARREPPAGGRRGGGAGTRY
jgi:CubicO group peptidase (beta-lactamase class C family)